MPASPYTDLDRPPLSAAALRRALVVPGGVWRRVDVRAVTASTNADVVAAARDGEPEGLVVAAERQTAGRGRQGRSWESPPRAGLMLSVLLRPGDADPDRGWAAVPARAYGWLPLLVGVALLETVRRVARVEAELKWPNDLLVTTVAGPVGKCAGILAEAAGAGAVVLGVGLNVTTRVEELPAAARGGLLPASLRLAGAAAADRDPLAKALLRGIGSWYERWRDAAGDPEAAGLAAAYRSGCATIGRSVRVLLPGDRELTGTAEGVDIDGRLLVRTPDGVQPVGAGDVVHVR
jgi:BirA family biotin operon repressor/biotin-[acetyl-CoA-carboxylase] ligase